MRANTWQVSGSLADGHIKSIVSIDFFIKPNLFRFFMSSWSHDPTASRSF